MLKSLRALAVAAALVGLHTLPAAAQLGTSGTMNTGFVTWAFSSDFELPLYYGGVGETFSPYLNYNGGNQAFHITGGMLDLNTGAGEIATDGGFVVVRGGTTLQIRRMTLDTTGSQPIITALVYNNATNMGRIPVFNMINMPFGATQLGVFGSGTYVTLSEPVRLLMQSDFGIPLAQGQVVASFHIDTTLVSDSGPQ